MAEFLMRLGRNVRVTAQRTIRSVALTHILSTYRNQFFLHLTKKSEHIGHGKGFLWRRAERQLSP
jgi:hypothetical protein